MAFYAHGPGAFPGGAQRTHAFPAHPTPNPLPDILRLMDGWFVGGGVDHGAGPGPHPYAGFPFAAPGSRRSRGGCCRRGGRGGPHRGHGPQERQDPPRDPEKSADPHHAQDPPEVAPESEPEQPPPYGRPGHPFDPSTLRDLFTNHPLAQALRGWAGPSSEDTFSPPLDLFETETEYVLHLALPGAKKEDVGVDWDPEAGELRAAGVVHRPGDEAFLQGLRSAERRVGVFERVVKLPPGEGGRKEEVDGEGIAARMEDGVLVVRVPKVEKEGWTEVRKVDIE